MSSLAAVFTSERLAELFPPERTDAFFEALFGGAEEGAYDIRLAFTRRPRAMPIGFPVSLPRP